MKAYLLLGAIACAFTFLLTPVVCRIARALHAMTPVRERDVHQIPTPRLGGVAMTFGAIGALLMSSRMPYFQPFYQEPLVWALMCGGLAICVLGFLDDLFDLTWWTKMAGQILIAGIVAWGGVQVVSFPIFGLTIGSNRLTIMFTVLVIVASTNAVNFVDGLDGLAAGIVAIASAAFFFYSYILIRVTESQSYATFAAMVAIVLCGVCVGFLTSNFYPAQIFMGDAGSMFLGYTLACAFIVVTGQVDPAELGSKQVLTSLIPLFLPVAVMFLPVLDMTMAIIRRLRKGQSPFRPDRMHLHHRLLRMGHSHRRAVLTLYLWACWGALLAVTLLLIPPLISLCLGCFGLLCCVLVTVVIMPGVRNPQQRYSRKPKGEEVARKQTGTQPINADSQRKVMVVRPRIIAEEDR